MSVPQRPRKRAKGRRRPQGRQRLLLDAQWRAESQRWHVSVEWYLDDLAEQPDGIEVWGETMSDLAIATRFLEMLQVLAKRARPSVGPDALDLREPGEREAP